MKHLFIVIALLVAFDASLRKAATAGPSRIRAQAATANPGEWREDLRVLASELPRRHINAFTKISAETWAEEIEALDAAIPTLPDHAIVIRMTRLVAMIGDAHTSLSWTSQRYPLRRYPISLTNRPDGVFVTRITAEQRETLRGPADYSRALGARVTHIGGMEIEQVKQRVTTLIATDNDVLPTFFLPSYLVVPEVLHALGIVSEMAHGWFTVEDAEGRRMELDLAPVAQGDLAQLTYFSWPGMRRWTQPLIFTRPSTQYYWHEYLGEKRTVYFRYSRCAEMSNLPFATFSRELLNVLDTGSVDRLVIDLRDNTGGNAGILNPFIESIRSRSWLNQTGRLFVLINRGTASSGVDNAITLQSRTRPILVGEPTGGKPNSFGEVRSFTLPYSGLTVNYSTRFFRLVAGDPPALAPNVFVEYPWSAYQAGCDPVLESALSY